MKLHWYLFTSFKSIILFILLFMLVIFFVYFSVDFNCTALCDFMSVISDL